MIVEVRRTANSHKRMAFQPPPGWTRKRLMPRQFVASLASSHRLTPEVGAGICWRRPWLLRVWFRVAQQLAENATMCYLRRCSRFHQAVSLSVTSAEAPRLPVRMWMLGTPGADCQQDYS